MVVGGFTLMALSVVLVGVAVLLLAFDTRLTRATQARREEQLVELAKEQHAQLAAARSGERLTRPVLGGVL